MVPIALLATIAPSIIRAAGKLIGGKADEAATIVADTIEDGGTLEGAQYAMPAELRVKLAEVANEAQKLANEREARGMQHDETMYTQNQETAREEQRSGTEFVKETRPKLARDSFAAGTVYVLLFEALELFGHGLGADPMLASILYGPCFTYLGMRTVDKWKGKPGTTV